MTQQAVCFIVRTNFASVEHQKVKDVSVQLIALAKINTWLLIMLVCNFRWILVNQEGGSFLGWVRIPSAAFFGWSACFHFPMGVSSWTDSSQRVLPDISFLPAMFKKFNCLATENYQMQPILAKFISFQSGGINIGGGLSLSIILLRHVQTILNSGCLHTHK